MSTNTRGVAASPRIIRSGLRDVSVTRVPRKLLCVGDSEGFRPHLQELYSGDWETVLVSGVEAASQALGAHDGIYVALVRLTLENCGVIEELAARHARLNWVAVVEEDDLDVDAVQRVLAGVFYDYHTLPIESDRLLVVLGHAYGMAALHKATLDTEPFPDRDEMQSRYMVGRSAQIRKIYSMIDKVARTDYPVLITGDSGTGKELVARAIHDKSERSNESLVVVNCGALTPTLIQSELFGHEKGSFTSADARKEGHFEAAHKGTIFLDEIAELPLDTQANLLRVLEDKFVRRVGGSRDIPMNVRVLAATNSNLSEAVKGGKFREDLLYRLRVVHIEIPPLSQRTEDIVDLAEYYLDKLAPEVGSKARSFSRSATQAMLAHAWPGNVRELINRVKRAVLLCETRLIGPDDMGLVHLRGQPQDDGDLDRMTLRKVREEAERKALIETMTRANSNISLAAERLGVSRVTLYNLLRKYEMR